MYSSFFPNQLEELTYQIRGQRCSAQGDRSNDFLVTCAPPVEFCEVDPMQTESLACTLVELQPSRPMHMRALQICMPVFARACARSEAYKSFQSYACHLRNPAVQQATVEIHVRDTEFPALPRPSIFGRSPRVIKKITLRSPSSRDP